MNLALRHRFAAAIASVAITFSLLNGLALMARPAPSTTLAQAAPTVVAQAATAITAVR
ncbi:MAG TPA: hypothetical protein VFF72_12680 [Caldimonas sp.]|nr:hypothetical protein [Caldimonas sp.]